LNRKYLNKIDSKVNWVKAKGTLLDTNCF